VIRSVAVRGARSHSLAILAVLCLRLSPPTFAAPDSALDRLAEALLHAQTEDAREAILTADSHLLTVELREALVERGRELKRRGRHPEASSVLNVAQRVAQRMEDGPGEAAVWNEIGLLRYAQGLLKEALELHLAALARCESAAEKECAARALIGAASVRNLEDDPRAALTYGERAIALAEVLENGGLTAGALIAVGNAWEKLGDYPVAEDHARRALSIAERDGETYRSAVAHGALGRLHRLRGETDLSIESLKRSAVLLEGLGETQAISRVYNQIGIAASLQGDSAEAMAFFQKFLATAEELGNPRDIADGLNNIGIVYRRQGDHGVALEFYRKALAVREAVGDRIGVVGSLNNIGLLCVDTDDYVRADEHLRKALVLAEALGNKNELANVLNNMGQSYRYQGAYGPALESMEKTLRLREELGDKGGAARALATIGAIRELQGDHQAAADFALRATALARASGFKASVASALAIAAKAQRALGQTGHARASLEESIALVEALRAQVAGAGQAQQRFFDIVASPYLQMVDLLAAEGDTSGALAYAERGKGRALLDLLRGGRGDVVKTMTDAERAQERSLARELVALNSQISGESRRTRPDQERLATLNGQLEKVRLAKEDFEVRLYASHPELKVYRGQAPDFRLAQAEAILPHSRTALIEYSVGEDIVHLFVVARLRDGEPVRSWVYPIPVKRPELRELARDLRVRVASRDLAIRDAARRAFELLLKPAREQLLGKTHLVIVPDDVLWELPFQALVTSANRYLIEETAVSYVPSFTVLREMMARRPDHGPEGATGSLLALGNPHLGKEVVERVRLARRDETLRPLPEAEHEVKTIGRLYDASRSEVLIGPAAREDRVKAEAGRFRVLHFATHGVVNDTSPMYSHLVLSQGGANEDGLLEAWELVNLDLRADLVILSACETARGRVSAGEGMIGLSWALFVAGSPTTVASQWKVDSASTTQMMLAFHTKLRGAARPSKAEALRSAALQMLRKAPYRHPFYWAGFIVMGDGS
jgi:CHAT domain-containing protein